MTNCPNCGAPYSIDNPVCAYCGTPCEGAEDDFEREETLGGAVRYRKVSCGRDVHTGKVYWVEMRDGETL